MNDYFYPKALGTSNPIVQSKKPFLHLSIAQYLQMKKTPSDAMNDER